MISGVYPSDLTVKHLHTGVIRQMYDGNVKANSLTRSLGDVERL